MPTTKTILFSRISAVATAVGRIEELASIERGRPVRWSDLAAVSRCLSTAWGHLADAMGECEVSIEAPRGTSLPASDRELDTILAALRFWQIKTWAPQEIQQISFEHGEPMTTAEIDALCCRLSRP